MLSGIWGDGMATYYVRVDGNNSNDGLGPGADRAFQAIDYAIEVSTISMLDDVIYIAPGTYVGVVNPINAIPKNLKIEGNTKGDKFGVAAGIINIPNDFIINLQSGFGYKTTIKNIIVDYFNCGSDTLEQSNLELINIISRGSFYIDSSYIYLIAKNCTDTSEFGGFYMGDGELYNCMAKGFWPLVVQMYNCMGPNVYPDEGSTVENHIYDTPTFVDISNNDFHLTEGSPGIGTGVVVDGYSPDIYGVLRGTSPDRGAAQIGGEPLVCEPLIITDPTAARCAIPMITLQTPSPVGAWLLHFKIEAYADAGGTQLLSTVDSSINPELWEYSTDQGLTWVAFPATGLPPKSYGALVRARVNIGPGLEAYLKASVGAEDA